MSQIKSLQRTLQDSYGRDWRILPLSNGSLPSGAAAEDSCWNLLRDDFPKSVAAAGLTSLSVQELVRVVARTLVPDVATDELDEAAMPLALGMVSGGTPLAVAALDAILTIASTAPPQLFGEACTSTAWMPARRIATAVLSRQLAAGGARLARLVGPGVLGSYVGAGGIATGQLAEKYLIHADIYIGWQQEGRCRCLGDATSESHVARAPRHHLRSWRPGRVLEAANLSLWFRTWVIGQQESGGSLQPKSLECGLLYRHFLRDLPEATLTVVIDEVLEERCDEGGCERFGERALRTRRLETVPGSPPGSRRCPANTAHDLSFTRPPNSRTRELIILSNTGRQSSHAHFSGLAWNRTALRWEFSLNGRTRRWLPVPHGRAYEHLLERARQSFGSTWTPEEIPRDLGVTSTDIDLDRIELPAELDMRLETLLKEFHGTGAKILDAIAELLLPSGTISRSDDCPCCTATSARGDICFSRLEDVVYSHLARRHGPQPEVAR